MTDDGHDEFEGMDAELQVLVLRAQLKEAEARQAADEEAKEALRGEIRRLRGETTKPGPVLLHPEDREKLPLDERAAMWGRIARGEVRLSPDAPRSPKRRVSRAERARMNLDERVAFDREWMKGSAELVE